MNDPQKYSPDMSDDENTGNKMIIGVVVGVSVLLAAVLGVSLLTRTETTDSDVPPVESVATSAPAPAASQVTIPQPERIDVELTSWNIEHGPEIAKILAMLGAPPVRDITLLRFRCKRMLELVGDLQSIPKPPDAGVAETFDLWLLSLSDAVTFCLEGSLELPDNEALPVAGSNLGSTSVFWDIFVRKLSEQVDLTGTPPGVTPELP